MQTTTTPTSSQYSVFTLDGEPSVSSAGQLATHPDNSLDAILPVRQTTLSSPPRPLPNLPRLQIPTKSGSSSIQLQPIQPLQGTLPSPTQKRKLRFRRESHPYYHAAISPRTAINNTITSYNQFVPYVLSPRRHTVSTTADKSEQAKTRAYLYRNRYPTIFTLILLALSLVPFAVLCTLLFSCYNAGKSPTSRIKKECNARNLMTAAVPLIVWVSSCWLCIWGFRERVIIFWLSLKQDQYSYEYEWRYTPAKRGTVLRTWSEFQGQVVEDLYNEGMSASDIQCLRQPVATTPKPKVTNPTVTAQQDSRSPLPHWSDLDHQIEPAGSSLKEEIYEHGTPYTPQLPKARFGRRHPACIPPDSIAENEFELEEFPNSTAEDPEAPGLTQEEKLRRWREMRRKELWKGLALTTSLSGGESGGQVVRVKPHKSDNGEGMAESRKRHQVWGGWVSSFGKGMERDGRNNKGKGKEKGKMVPERELDISGPIF